jgi:hypothetical protein
LKMKRVCSWLSEFQCNFEIPSNKFLLYEIKLKKEGILFIFNI